MLKNIITYIRWGNLPPEEESKLQMLSLKEIFKSPYLTRKFYG